MVPFYGTVYKSSLYDLIIPFPACKSGAEREKKTCGCFCVRENRKKANNLIINSLWIVFYVEWHQLLNCKCMIENYLYGMAPIKKFKPLNFSDLR